MWEPWFLTDVNLDVFNILMQYSFDKVTSLYRNGNLTFLTF